MPRFSTTSFSIIIKICAFGLLISGCSSNTPSCSDSETKDLVIQIAKDELKKQYAESNITNIQFEVSSIRTTNHNKDVDKYDCAADFKMISNEETILPITYTVESTDKNGEFYVTVEGF